jgi:polyisoprenoid-binding protein YceI
MSPDQVAPKKKRSRLFKVVVGVIVVGVLAVTAGPFIYINFIKDDAPKRLSIDDAPIGDAAAATAASTATTAAPSASSTVDATVTSADGTTAGTVTTGTIAPTATTAPGGVPAATPGAADATTYTLTADSQAGYRVTEVLFGQDTEGVGRTNSVTGSITLAGAQVTAADFTVDMATLVSDESNRDRKFKGDIMETSKFPTATFVITQPIELGTVPADDTEITASATGDLTLHGVTKSVTLDVTAKRTGSSIAIAGSTDVVFGDYDIDNPSNGGITTEDHGLIEFLLVATA